MAEQNIPPKPRPAQQDWIARWQRVARRIRVPLGFLLTAVPKCFKGDSYRQFRAERERSREVTLERDRLFAAEILKSPEADEEQKQWAREVLGAG